MTVAPNSSIQWLSNPQFLSSLAMGSEPTVAMAGTALASDSVGAVSSSCGRAGHRAVFGNLWLPAGDLPADAHRCVAVSLRSGPNR